MSPQTPSPDLAQLRGEHVAERVAQLQSGPARVAEGYRTTLQTMPVTIELYGLGQACAWLLDRADGNRTHPDHRLFDDLQSWLCRNGPGAPYDGRHSLMDAFVHNDQDAYLAAQAEALRWLDLAIDALD